MADQAQLFGEPYRCVAADPPWAERGGGQVKRGADRHYPLLTVPEIIEVMLAAPPWARVGSSAHLWLWVTDNFLEGGLDVMRALGFRYVRTWVWVKTKAGAVDLDADALQRGLGQYGRGSHELVLFGARGESMVPPPDRRPPSVITATRTRHSAKPVEAFTVFETVSPGPRLEMFARQPREGWSVWGNEVPERAGAEER